jgi:hypothetical protein
LETDAFMDSHRVLSLAGVLIGYGLLMGFSPVRSSLRDGAHCLSRYRQLWILPAVCAVSHAIFRWWVRWLEASMAADARPFLSPWQGWQTPGWNEALSSGWLPALENTAGLFNCMVSIFPVSALAAVLFLFNWHGYQGTLFRALKRRLGTGAGMLAHAGLVVCAAAAVAKPALFGGLPRMNALLGADALLRLGELVNWLGFAFEYLLGVGLQVYLILLCFVWLRGLSFDFENLRRFSLRRLPFVFKWSGVILALSTLSINLPMIAASWLPPLDLAGQARLDSAMVMARWSLALVILAFCAVQITLVFHNESLRRALKDHGRLLRFHGGRVGWMALTALGHFYLLALLNFFLGRGLGEGTLPALVWSLAYPFLWALMSGWFLASWVCLFRRCETGRADTDELVKF